MITSKYDYKSSSLLLYHPGCLNAAATNWCSVNCRLLVFASTCVIDARVTNLTHVTVQPSAEAQKRCEVLNE